MNRIVTTLCITSALLCGANFMRSNAQTGTPPKTMNPPEWIVRLFSHTGSPDRLEHRLRRIEATEQSLNGHQVGSVIAELSYPDMYGKDHLGKVRIFLPLRLRDSPTQRLPLIHNAGYELDEKNAADFAAKGYVVCTPHAEAVHPLCRNINLDLAILHAVRRLPFIDPLRVSIQGVSAGGWMTLMLTADAFPLVCSMPDVPLVHFGYNIAYLEASRAVAEKPHGETKPNMPFLAVVSMITDQVRPFYGMPYESATYFAVSPLAHIETITSPTLVTFSTADVLVPIDQVDEKFVLKRDPALIFPEYTSAMTDKFPGYRGKRTLLKALPSSRYELFQLSVPTDLPRIRMGPTQAPSNKKFSLPFSQSKPWSVVVLDEGAAERGVAHTKYVWGMDHEPFRRWAEAKGVTAEQLTSAKLQRLMKRYKGETWRPLQVRPEGKGEEIAGNQMDYPEAERADVLLGLTAFAEEDARALHLARLYSRLPAKLKVFGTRLGEGSASSVRAALNNINR